MADTNAVSGSATSAGSLITLPSLELEFCGERQRIADGPFLLGARADLNLDDPPALPDTLLELRPQRGLWFLRQTAPGPEVILFAGDGAFAAEVSRVGAVPLVFDRQLVSIAAGRATYEVELCLSEGMFRAAPPADRPPRIVPDVPQIIPTGMDMVAGEDPLAPVGASLDVGLNHEQRVLLTVLAAPVLRGGPSALSDIPSSVEAARLLDWPVTKFNRKLDTVCGKLARAGITGLHGGANRPALNRRTRLVQVAVAAGVVTVQDLVLLAEFPLAD